MISKEWIENNCFTKTGNLNNRTMIESWWENRSFDLQLKYIKQVCDNNNHTSLCETLYTIYHDIKPRTCKICKEPTTFVNFKRGYREYCSLQCTYLCEERNSKIAVNTDQAAKQETMKRTNIERYGVERTSKMFAYKTKETKLARYGNANYNNSQKITETIRNRYGVNWASQIPDKIEKTMLVRAEKIPELRDPEWLFEKSKTMCYSDIGELIGVSEYAVGYWFKQLGIRPANKPNSFVSKPQREIVKYIESLGVVYEINSSVIRPKHLDVFVPSCNVGIELNGLFWHSDYYAETYNSKKHLEKTKMCDDVGIRCIQLWSNQWEHKKDICKSIICNALGKSITVYARKTTVVELSIEDYRQFMNENHLDGYAHSTIRYGLLHNGVLVQAIGFSKSRYNKNYEYEIVRSATKKFHSVKGGFSKLMNRKPSDSLISYCNRMMYNGNGYRAVGMRHLHDTGPNYFYFRPNEDILHSRLQFQKHKLKDKLEVYDESLPEHVNMRNNGWLRVHDCGNGVWVTK